MIISRNSASAELKRVVTKTIFLAGVYNLPRGRVGGTRTLCTCRLHHAVSQALNVSLKEQPTDSGWQRIGKPVRRRVETAGNSTSGFIATLPG